MCIEWLTSTDISYLVHLQQSQQFLNQVESLVREIWYYKLKTPKTSKQITKNIPVHSHTNECARIQTKKKNRYVQQCSPLLQHMLKTQTHFSMYKHTCHTSTSPSPWQQLSARQHGIASRWIPEVPKNIRTKGESRCKWAWCGCWCGSGECELQAPVYRLHREGLVPEVQGLRMARLVGVDKEVAASTGLGLCGSGQGSL